MSVPQSLDLRDHGGVKHSDLLTGFFSTGVSSTLLSHSFQEEKCEAFLPVLSMTFHLYKDSPGRVSVSR